MRILPLVALMLLSCIAISEVRADVIVTNGATVINNDRFADDRNNQVQIYNGNAGYYPQSAFVLKDGKFEPLPDGTYYQNGQKVNITNGRMNATFGNQDIQSRVKINP